MKVKIFRTVYIALSRNRVKLILNAFRKTPVYTTKNLLRAAGFKCSPAHFLYYYLYPLRRLGIITSLTERPHEWHCWKLTDAGVKNAFAYSIWDPSDPPIGFEHLKNFRPTNPPYFPEPKGEVDKRG